MKQKIHKCYYCKELINDVSDLTDYNLSKDKTTTRYFHINCLSEYLEKKEQKEAEKRLKIEEKNMLYTICDFIKYELINYDRNMKMPKYAVMRILGLRNGNYIAPKNSKVSLSKDGYPYKVILMTFQIKKLDIIKGMKNNQFKDEQHKINYIMSIITGSINDVYIRFKEREKSKENLDNIQINLISLEENNNQFKNKTNINGNKVANALEDLF